MNKEILAEDFAKKNDDPWDRGNFSGALKEGFLGGWAAALKYAPEIKGLLGALECNSPIICEQYGLTCINCEARAKYWKAIGE